MESEQATPVVSIKDVVRSSMKVSEFDKYLKSGGHIDRNVETIETINVETIETIKSDNSPKTLNDKNQQASSQKFRQLKKDLVYTKCLDLIWFGLLGFMAY